MACHDIGWVLSARMCFRSLDFVVTTEGDLEEAPALVLPSPATSLDMVVEALEGLQLHPSESGASEYGQLDGSYPERSEHQPITWGFFPLENFTWGFFPWEIVTWGSVPSENLT